MLWRGPLRPFKLPLQVTLERQLVFTYSDFNDENFMFNTDSEGHLRFYLIDFEHASFLPTSMLASVVLQNGLWWSTKPIAQRIGAMFPTANLDALARAFYIFHTYGHGVGLEKKDPRFAPKPVRRQDPQEGSL
jgi:hypothetical protein